MDSVPLSRSSSNLRGAYGFTGTAWQDLSELSPALPRGYAPVSITGAFTIEGNGAMTGWALVNAGGLQMAAEFVNSTFGAPRADCAIPMTLSMKFKQFEDAVMGPYSYVGVVTDDGGSLEIAFMMLGTGPGSHLELDHAKRISMRAQEALSAPARGRSRAKAARPTARWLRPARDTVRGAAPAPPATSRRSACAGSSRPACRPATAAAPDR